MHGKWLNGSNWLIDGTLTGTTTPGQSGSEGNGNGVGIYIPSTPGCSLVLYPRHSKSSFS